MVHDSRSVRSALPEGGDTEAIQTWWERARPAQRRCFLPPRPVIHVRRAVERDLVASLTTLSSYRQARWRSIILYGMAGIGKTAIARALADDDQVQRAFRDGVACVDGCRDPEEPRLPYVVRPGRAALYSALGYVNAAYELRRQINCGILPEPARIYVPVRTGSIAAGLLLGCRLAHIRSRIVVVTCGDSQRPSVLPQARRTSHHLHRKTRRFIEPALRREDFELRGEYAGSRGDAAAAVHQMTGLVRDLESLSVDPMYGGRAMAALAHDLRSQQSAGPALLWHAPQPHIANRRPRVTREELPREFREFFVAR